jgi:hypothetical protein
VHGLAAGKQLEHFLLAVARGLRDHGIGHGKEGTDVFQDKTVTRFDERTEVCRQHRLGSGDGIVGKGAEGYGYHVEGAHDFCGRIRAVGAYDLCPALPVVEKVRDEALPGRFIPVFVIDKRSVPRTHSDTPWPRSRRDTGYRLSYGIKNLQRNRHRGEG